MFIIAIHDQASGTIKVVRCDVAAVSVPLSVIRMLQTPNFQARALDGIFIHLHTV